MIEALCEWVECSHRVRPLIRGYTSCTPIVPIQSHLEAIEERDPEQDSGGWLVCSSERQGRMGGCLRRQMMAERALRLWVSAYTMYIV